MRVCCSLVLLAEEVSAAHVDEVDHRLGRDEARQLLTHHVDLHVRVTGLGLGVRVRVAVAVEARLGLG